MGTGVNPAGGLNGAAGGEGDKGSAETGAWADARIRASTASDMSRTATLSFLSSSSK